MRGTRTIVLILAGLALFAPWARAQTPTGDEGKKKNLSWKAEAAYAQKYIWRGIDLQEDTPSIQPALTLDLLPAGVYFSGWGNVALDGEYRDWDEADLIAGKYFSLFSEKSYQADFDLAYSYFYFYHQPRIEDTHELVISLGLPGLLRLPAGLSFLPAFSGYYNWGHRDDKGTIWLKPAIELALPLPSFGPGPVEPTIRWSGETWYSNGYPAFQVGRGWGFLAMELSAEFARRGIILQPGFHYQYVFHRSPSRETEFWFSLSLAYER